MTGDLPATPPRRTLWPPTRAGWALLLALAADGIQLGLAPVFFEGALSPINDALDVAICVAMVRLLGWHYAFLPALAGEMLPVVDLFPTWTAAVLFVAARRKQRLRPGSPGGKGLG